MLVLQNSKQDRSASHREYGKVTMMSGYSFTAYGTSLLVSRLNKRTILTHELLLNLFEIWNQRVLILNTLVLNEGSVKLEWNPHIDSVISIWAEFDIIMSLLGNKAFALIKAWEPLCIGRLLKMVSSKVLDVLSFDNETISGLVGKIGELCGSDHIKVSLVKSSLSKIHDILRDETRPEIVSQLYGMCRLWGHPLVRVEDGLRQVRRLGTLVKAVSATNTRRMVCLLKETIFLNYYNLHHIYPKFILTSESENYVSRKLTASKRINIDHSRYQLMDWSGVVAGKTFEIPSIIDLNLLISDKAVSPTKLQMIENYRRKRGMGPAEHRKVNIRWLTSNFPSIETFLNDIDENGIPENDMLIGAWPKEREMNNTPRSFAICTPILRTYIMLPRI